MEKDLFGSVAMPVQASFEQKNSFLERYRVTLRFDQAVIALILMVVIYILVFSFGVESGKRYAMAELKAERAKRERMVQELGEKIFANNNINATPGTGAIGAKPAIVSASAKVGQQPVAKKAGISAAIAVAPGAIAAKTAEESSKSPAGEVAPSGKYTIQVITFTSQAVAEKHLKRLAEKGHKSFLISKGKYLHVCVDGFDSKEQADQILRKLKEQGIAPKDAYVRPLAAPTTA